MTATTTTQDAPSADYTVNGSADVTRQMNPQAGVGIVRQLESELDRVIAELGQHMVWAQSIGDSTGARLYLDRANAMRASRTPQHQARLDAEDRIRAEELTMGAPWVEEFSRLRFDVKAASVRRRISGRQIG